MEYYTGVKTEQQRNTKKLSMCLQGTYLRHTAQSKGRLKNCLQGMLHLGKKLKGKSFYRYVSLVFSLAERGHLPEEGWEIGVGRGKPKVLHRGPFYTVLMFESHQYMTDSKFPKIRKHDSESCRTASEERLNGHLSRNYLSTPAQ